MNDLTPEQRIERVAKEITAIQLGVSNLIHCPYCDADNAQGQTFCCDTLMRAVAAVLDRKHFEEQKRQAEAIGEKALLN